MEIERCDCILSIRGATQCWKCKLRDFHFEMDRQDKENREVAENRFKEEKEGIEINAPHTTNLR